MIHFLKLSQKKKMIDSNCLDLVKMVKILDLLPSRIFCSTGPAVDPQRSQRYLRRYFVDSVFPAPDSPETIILCDCFSTFMSLKDLSAERKI